MADTQYKLIIENANILNTSLNKCIKFNEKLKEENSRLISENTALKKTIKIVSI